MPHRWGRLIAALIVLAAACPAAAQQDAPSDRPGSPSAGAGGLPVENVEIVFWKTVKDSNDPALLQAYLDRYPAGEFAPLAKIMIEKLKASTAAPASPASSPATAALPAGRKLTLRAKLDRRPGTDGVERGALGIKISPVNAELAKSIELPAASGALVAEVLPDSAGAAAGVKPGDIVLAVEGREGKDIADITRIISSHAPAAEVNVDLWRVGEGPTDLAHRLQQLSDGGDPGASLTLARLLQIGVGGSKDEAEIVRLFRKAAEGGLEGGMTNLAWMLANGRGTAKDEAEAVRLWRQAADKGGAEAMFRLGVMLQNGRGVAKDETQAARWYRQAVDKGIPEAMSNLAWMLSAGQGVAKDEAEAVRLWRQAAEKGSADGMYNLGVMLQKGRGIAKDEAEAARWYRQAVDKGLPEAMHNLAWMLNAGRGVAKDEAEAARLWRQAAEKGSADGMHNLAWTLENGRGVAKDEAEAVRWYRQAIEKGSVASMYNLAVLLNSGRGVAKSSSEAAQWLYASLEKSHEPSITEMTTNAAAWDPDVRKDLQRRLKDAGYYDGPIDGTFGPLMVRAIEALAKKQ